MKVIITDCDHDSIDIEKKVFADAEMEVELKQAITEDEVIEQCQDAEIFIVQYAKITKKVMDNCPKLKYVVRYGVGVDTIDVPEATKHGIQVGNVPDYGMNEVADHAIALAMVMVREIVKMNQFITFCTHSIMAFYHVFCRIFIEMIIKGFSPVFRLFSFQ